MHACVYVSMYVFVCVCIHVHIWVNVSIRVSIYGICEKDEDVLAFIERDKIAKLENSATKNSPVPDKVIITIKK